MCLPYLVAFMVALCPLLNPFKVFQIPTVLILTSPVTKTNNNCKKIKIYSRHLLRRPKAFIFFYGKRFWKKNVSIIIILCFNCYKMSNTNQLKIIEGESIN